MGAVQHMWRDCDMRAGKTERTHEQSAAARHRGFMPDLQIAQTHSKAASPTGARDSRSIHLRVKGKACRGPSQDIAAIGSVSLCLCLAVWTPVSCLHPRGAKFQRRQSKAGAARIGFRHLGSSVCSVCSV